VFKYKRWRCLSLVKPDTSYQNIRFHGDPTPGNAGVLYIRNLVVYRGDDVVSPSRADWTGCQYGGLHSASGVATATEYTGPVTGSG